MIERRMRRFWNRRAEEDPFFFVDNRLEYRRPDLERFWAEGQRDLDRLLERLGLALQPGDVVVEVGCGVGRLTRVLGARTRGVWALDVSPRMLELAERHNLHLSNVRWLLCDGRSLHGVPDSAADAFVSLVVFQHVPEPEITLDYVREVGRVLRPGGWAAFQVSNDPRVHQAGSGRGAVKRRLNALVHRAPRGQGHPAWLGSAVALDDLASAARDGGMELERVEGAGTQFCLVSARRSR